MTKEEFAPLLREVEVTAYRAGLKMGRLLMVAVVAFAMVAMCYIWSTLPAPKTPTVTAAAIASPTVLHQQNHTRTQVDPMTALELKAIEDLWVLYDCFQQLAKADSETDKFAIRWKAVHAKKRLAKMIHLLNGSSLRGEIEANFTILEKNLRAVW